MNQIQDKVFMFTGTLNVTREKAREVVENLGGIAGSSLGKKTNYLVCGSDQIGKSSKFITAGILGVKRLTEEEFWEMVKSAEPEKEEILLSKEELEHWNDITEEKWKEIKEKNPGLQLMSESQFERLMEVKGNTSPSVSAGKEEKEVYLFFAE